MPVPSVFKYRYLHHGKFKKKIIKADKPNVVLINIDSLRADHMGVYGYTKPTTPFLDSLFKQGVVFENAITPGYLTFQTDAAILSGLYPSKNNVQQWATPIKGDLDLLPRILGYYGYKTAAFVSPSLWPAFGFSKQFDLYKLNTSTKNVAVAKEEISKYLVKSSKPTFVFWHIYDVHSPYLDPTSNFYSKKYAGLFADKQTRWFWEGQSKDAFTINISRNTEGATHEVTPEDVSYLQASYDSGIRYVDGQLRSFFDSIKQEPWYKNTIFIISSEHGEDLKEHGFIFHRDLYDVNTRVPLAMVIPGRDSSRIKQAVSSLDIMPTVLDLIGGTVPTSIDGEDLVPLMNGTSAQRDIFTERPPYDEYSVRRGGWKYILRNPGKKKDDQMKIYDAFMTRMIKNDDTVRDEFYNLDLDPTEQHNLLGTGLPLEKELKQAVLQFKAKMTKARADNQLIKDVPPPGGVFIPYP